MKIILAPDSFKGSLMADAVCAAMAQGVRRAKPDAHIVSITMADGGEGTTSAPVSATGGQIHHVNVTGPLGDTVKAFFGILGDSSRKTAVIEMACAAGLPLVPSQDRDPRKTTTYGVGEVVRAALDEGVREFVIGIGGSATNDCGCGMLQALGVQFFNLYGHKISEPISGGLLSQIAHIDTEGLIPQAKESTFMVACDVENPLLGLHGATYTFAGQKGADDIVKAELESKMAHVINIIEGATGQMVRNRTGAGAAGGMGAGLMAFLKATIASGAELVIQYSGLAGQLFNTDIVLTGEGRFDRTSGYGKVVSGLAKEARRYSVPLVVLSGSIGDGAEILLQDGVTAYF